MVNANKILVIKLSALGDFIQSLGAMKAIKDHHKNAKITLLTTKPFENIARQSGYFDDIIIDKRPKFFQVKEWVSLFKKLNDENFSRVYDLQCNDRTALYFKLFIKKPEWVGTVKQASHRDIISDKKTMPAFKRHQNNLSLAGLHKIEIDRLEWMNDDISAFPLEEIFALIVPGCAPSRPEKRWSADYYARLCQKLVEKNVQPVLIGTKSEKDIINNVHQKCPDALNLCDKTNLFQLPALARKAQFAVGNDTGPMHLIGPTACKTVVLFSGASNPTCHKPLGQNVHTLQKDNINDIALSDVMDIIYPP